MLLERMLVSVEWKAADDGTLEGYLSTFGNVDLGYDVVQPGAFDETIKRLKKDGGIPLLADHVGMTSHVLGTIYDATPDKRGLKIKARFSSAPSAQDTRIKLVEGHVRKMSMGYIATKYSFVEVEGKGTVRSLDQVDLKEGSVVVFAMNEEADVLRAKSFVHSLPPSARQALAHELAQVDEKATVNDQRDQLQQLLREAYGADGVDVWVRDFDDAKVWFVVWTAEGSDTFEQAFTSDGDTLALDGDRTKVRAVTTYVPADGKSVAVETSAPPAEPSTTPDEPEAAPAGPTSDPQGWDHYASEALLEGRDPTATADPAQVAGLRTRLELSEAALGLGSDSTESE